MPRIRFDFGSTLLAMWVISVVLTSEYIPTVFTYAFLSFVGCVTEASIIGSASYVRVYFGLSYTLRNSIKKRTLALPWLYGSLAHLAFLSATLVLLLTIWQMPFLDALEAERLLLAKLILGTSVLLAVQALPQSSTLLGRFIKAVSELLRRDMLGQQQLEGFLTLLLASAWCFLAVRVDSLALAILNCFLAFLAGSNLLTTHDLIEFRQDQTGRALYRLLDDSQKSVFCGRSVPANWTIAEFKENFRPKDNEKIAFIVQNPKRSTMRYIGLREVDALTETKDIPSKNVLLEESAASHEVPVCRIDAPLKTIETQIVAAPEQEIILINDQGVPVMLATRRLLEALYNTV